MAKRAETPSSYPEYAVRAEIIHKFFDPPISTSTFHELVNKGRIVSMKELRGYYLLNDSLRRLGLREVPHPPKNDGAPSLADLARLAFTMLDYRLFPAPSWMLQVEALDLKLVDHARRMADQYRGPVEELGSVEEKVAYFSGAVEAQEMIEADAEREGAGR